MAPPFPSRVALASATSDNGTARNGAAVNSFEVAAGVLVADVSITIVTGSVVCTTKWQGSADGGTTWVDIKPMNNAASVTTTATATLALECPLSAWAFQQLRIVMTLSGAATAAGDLTAATYRFVPAGKLAG